MEHKSLVESIHKTYPGLFDKNDLHDFLLTVILKDNTKRKYRLFVGSYSGLGIGVGDLRITLISETHFEMVLIYNWYNRNEPPFGILTMNYDFGLNDDYCAHLYNLGINIFYQKEGVKNISYDRVGIMRRHTIKSIINE